MAVVYVIERETVYRPGEMVCMRRARAVTCAAIAELPMPLANTRSVLRREVNCEGGLPAVGEGAEATRWPTAATQEQRPHRDNGNCDGSS